MAAQSEDDDVEYTALDDDGTLPGLSCPPSLPSWPPFDLIPIDFFHVCYYNDVIHFPNVIEAEWAGRISSDTKPTSTPSPIPVLPLSNPPILLLSLE